jgi:hypothetical protein
VANVFLVCEGPANGLDERILDVLVIQGHGLAAQVVAAGGDRGLGAVRAFHHHPPHDIALSIEDRNHRPRPEAEPTWANAGGTRFIWRRHEIENYVLEPAVVLELFEDYRRTLPPGWPQHLPTTLAAVSTLLQQIASALLEDHAAGAFCAELVLRINTAGNPNFGPTPPAIPAGAVAPGQADWLPVLQSEAARVCHDCLALSALAELQQVGVAARYAALVAQYQVPGFLTSGDYLIDIGGKELLRALLRHLRVLGAPARLRREDLEDQLVQAAERVYQPNALYHPDDFAQLATILAQY